MMNTEISIEQLLRWRLGQAESQAPRAPRAAHLLERARPWWETWPERYSLLVERLAKVQVAYGHAMAEPRPSRSGHLVPALVMHSEGELESAVRLLYFCVREGRLRVRFQLDAGANQAAGQFEVIFVSEKTLRPMLEARAARSVDSEYSLDAELTPELAGIWGQLKVTDRMPFRLILNSKTENG